MDAYYESAVLQTPGFAALGHAGVTWGQSPKYKEYGEDENNPKRKTYLPFIINPGVI